MNLRGTHSVHSQFYGNTAPATRLWIFCDVFMLPGQRAVVATEPARPEKAKIVIVWVFTENVADPALGREHNGFSIALRRQLLIKR